ncbi:hypothetical protein ACH4NR_32170 [Streptomyces globisporus]|uniref:hypothetical protein n=1 Tax=Streptomyces griseus group TaxID=629295 RepID=UPI002F911E29|nr:hypothetical protein OH791_39405 [Streptomyces anulatus]
MTEAHQFVVAGRDLSAYVEEWIADLEDPNDPLLIEARRDPSPRERVSYGASYVMKTIAPKVWGDQGGVQELLLFAVLATFPATELPDWEDCATYVERAFDHMHRIGEVEAARRLRAEVEAKASEEYARERSDMYRALGRPLEADPARTAYWERELAKGNERSLRAAAVLDPEGNRAPWEQ